MVKELRMSPVDPSAPLLAALTRQRILPVLRSATAEDAIATSRALALEGITVVELTTSTPDVHAAARTLVDDGLIVGIGTLRSAAELDAVAASGASFGVSYFVPDGFVERAAELGLVAIPGGVTPGELQSAAGAGAGVLKIFPAWQSHPRFIADLEPLLGPRSYVVTGISGEDDIRSWLAAGAVAVGVGRQAGTFAEHGEAGVRERARHLLAVAGD
jgi:2-dehydro-3-deoxyphosphogluconate aldolase/(4S)-4-hydroxy-2-oxoglutarate aldolase